MNKPTIIQGLTKKVLDSAPFGVYFIDKDGSIEYFNPAMVQMAGAKDSTEIEGLNVFKMADYKKVGLDRYISRGLAGEPFRLNNLKITSVTGRKTTVRNYLGIPIFDEKNRVLLLILLVEDITEKYQTQEALKQEKKRLQQILDVASSIIITLDERGKIMQINDAGANILGAKAREIIGQNWFDNYIPQESREKIKKIHSQVISGNLDKVQYYENEIVTRQKERRLIAWHNSNLKEGQKIIATISSGLDLTEHHQAEIALREQEKKLRTIFNSAADGMVQILKNGQIIAINKQFERLTGYSSKDFIGKNIRALSNIFPKKSLLVILGNFVKRFRGQEISPYEVKMIRADGSKFDVEINARIYHQKGQKAGEIAILRDISERKRMERNLQNLNQNLQEKINQLETYKEVTVGRELKIVELKNQIKELKRELAEK